MAIELGREQLIGMARAARMLGVHPDTVRAYLRRGQLEGVEVGGRLKTSVEAVRRFVRPTGAAGAPRRRPEWEEAERQALEELRAAGIAL
jgi:excisionase family DNA binding protein